MSGAAVESSSTQPGPVAIVLVTADWAGPSRPAPTLLRELSRRWGSAVRAVLVDSAQDDVLDLLEVEVVPTWLRLHPVESVDATADDALMGVVEDLAGKTPTGDDIVLSGRWAVNHRRTGALPKHVIAEEFGPGEVSRSGSDGQAAPTSS